MSSDHFPFQNNLTGPPRSVPLAVRWRLLLGGYMNQFGWSFFGFGMIFVWVFVMNADLTGWYVFRGPLETATGTTTRCEKTNASSNDGPVYAIDYQFDAGGVQHHETSFTTGKSVAAGESVTVEFPTGDPSRSRIRGMRTSVFGLAPLIVVIFPLIGMCFMFAGWRSGWKAVRLLRHGEQTTGRLKSKEATSTRIDNQPVYRMIFEFTAADSQTYEAVAKTHVTEPLEDDARERLMYDPFHPTEATLLDHLPGSPRIDEMGEIRNDSSLRTALVLVIPLATVLGHGSYAYLRYFAN